MTTVIPSSHLDLLTKPVFSHFTTLRSDGWPQTNPMWFTWDGTHLRLTGTTTRYKHRNILRDPHVTLCISDPAQPYRYLEVRGVVVDIADDSKGVFFAELADRYALPMDGPPDDVADRVVYVIAPDRATVQ
ncbi:PPOX class F420-dependent oxidoreductase [Rathayibacter tritici]|uniref:PPOX class F420-dependent enzyme n=1 Tax=Rathayibacter tritici TaxID=33888 RepID=A0A160KPW7_9MICO|nr:PPOX class F420-dependent oxidoreductase [Rathayibacter tritici]AND15237.1 PPOX class F420-dependent enzyme [Rathayibacter tritici]PPI40637.1 PPOX class F420-dependent oxidoreductase [Rathayibacter tritici]